MRRPRSRLARYAVAATILALVVAVDGVSALAPVGNAATTTDTFTRTVSNGWGSAPGGGTYTVSGTASAWSVNGSRGGVKVSTGTTRLATMPWASMRDVQVAARVGTDRLATGGGQSVALVARRQSTGLEYDGRVRIDSAKRVYLAAVKRGSTETVLGTEVLVTGLTYTPNTYLRLKLAVSGTAPSSVKVKAWADAATEPTTWQVTRTDTTTELKAAGLPGVRASTAKSTTNGPTSFFVDDLTVSPLGSTGGGPVSTTRRYGALSGTSLNYAVPTGAFFVNPSSGNDLGPGTQSLPWQTVQHAASTAPTGSTIVLRAGRYHESVTFPYGKALTLQPYPHEQVVFDGAVPVSGWASDGSAWRHDGWTAEFKEGGRPDLVTSQDPLAAYPEMVFYDGQQLRQVASRAGVTTGTFFVDQVNDMLYIGSTPSGHAVEASDLARAIFFEGGDGSTIRGIRFQRYATHPDLYATVVAVADSVTFENDEFLDNASVGVSLIGKAEKPASNGKLIDNTSARNGQMGIHSHRSDGLLLSGNWVHHNNLENFYLAGAQGGVKVTYGTNSRWTTNLAEDNRGDGLWCDEYCNNVTIVNNVARRNLNRGIKYELSANAILAGNLATDNATYGILVNESNDVQVWNNTSVRNQRNIETTEGYRTGSGTFQMDTRNITIRNNLMAYGKGSGTVVLLAIEDFTKTATGAQMNVTADYDGYYRVNTSSPTLLAVWPNGATQLNCETMAEFQQTVGQETHGLSIDSTVDPFFVNATANDFRLKSDSVAKSAGTPLPPAVAQALGATAGVPIDMGMINP